MKTLTLLVPVGLLCLFCVSSGDVAAGDQLFHNQFAVFIPKGRATADDLATRHGFVNLGQIGDLSNYYLFEHARIHRRSAERAHGHALLLTEEPEVKWFEQQEEKRRKKRDDYENGVRQARNEGRIDKRPLWDSIFEEEEARQTAKLQFKRQSSFNSITDPCLLYTSPSPRDRQKSRMPSSA